MFLWDKFGEKHHCTGLWNYYSAHLNSGEKNKGGGEEVYILFSIMLVLYESYRLENNRN